MISAYPWKDGIKFFVPGAMILASTIAIPGSMQQVQGYAAESLFMAVFANGDALVEYDVSIDDPLTKEIRIKLFGGTHINDLIVVDYEDNLVEYNIGSSPNEIILNTPGISNVRISYSTPDLVDKSEGLWIFSFVATTNFSVRLPSDTVLVDYEPIPTIKFYDDQPLLTFDKPGSIRVSYAIGVLGTEDQANIAIQLASVTIKQTGDRYPDINLTAAQDLLQRAGAARDAGKFAEAESLADKANDTVVTAGKDYESAKIAIANARTEVDKAASEGRSIASARALLEQANTEFASGNYVSARNSADSAVQAIGTKDPEPQIPMTAILVGLVGAVGGAGLLIFLRMRKPAVLQVRQKRELSRIPDNGLSATELIPPTQAKEEVENVPNGAEAVGQQETSIDAMQQGTIPESQIDKSVLARIVSSILEERSHLRPEDQQVLKFLAEKEGAAFESEIRTRFQLPKTTIWRLVKRLEREELVEIRKAGGQNLIKLKFEDKIR